MVYLLVFIAALVGALCGIILSRVSVDGFYERCEWYRNIDSTWRAEAFYSRPEIAEHVNRLERQYNLRLSPGARLMLTVPISEEFDRLAAEGSERESAFVSTMASLELIFASMAEEPDPRDSDSSLRRSPSVIRAFWKRFCNIPPFCRPAERQ
jgi:hypothetical protein